MKRILYILIALAALCSCGGKSLKVTDPAERQALRTRDAAECPADSLFTAKTVEITLGITDRIKPKALLSDFRQSMAESEQEKPVEKVKEAYASVKSAHSAEYGPGLTLYCAVMLVALVVVIIVKIFKALFKK